MGACGVGAAHEDERRDIHGECVTTGLDGQALTQSPAAGLAQQIATVQDQWVAGKASANCSLTNTALMGPMPIGPDPCAYPMRSSRRSSRPTFAKLWTTATLHALCADPANLPWEALRAEVAGNAMYCSLDDQLASDTRLVASLDDEFGKNAYGPIPSAIVLAHEWGHRNQVAMAYPVGTRSKLAYSIQLELNADCQAGMFAAVEELRYGLSAGALGEIFKLFCSLGDPQGTTWFGETTHGTCSEREAAFIHGYLAALSSQAQETTECRGNAGVANVIECAWTSSWSRGLRGSIRPARPPTRHAEFWRDRPAPAPAGPCLFLDLHEARATAITFVDDRHTGLRRFSDDARA